MLVEERGGVPICKTYTATEAGITVESPCTSKYLLASNHDTSGDAVRIYFSQVDFDADVNWQSFVDGSPWQGPVELAAPGGSKIWFRSVSGAGDQEISVIFFQRRG